MCGEALKYKDNVVKRWEDSKEIVKNYYENVLGLTEEREFVVNIVNPIACTGTNNMKNEIFYGNDIGIESIGFDVT